jgi:hypothetical protein
MVLGLLLLCNLGWVLRPGEWKPTRRADERTYTIFSYRQWQSVGLKLEAGDRYTLRATGEWAYSPLVGLHGPTGGMPAVSSYPMPGWRGGALLGRIGEDGAPFYVGARLSGYAVEAGLLYLRINDDLLGDNQGEMQVTVDIIRAEVTPSP